MCGVPTSQREREPPLAVPPRSRAVALVSAPGLVDDRREVRPSQKLAGQVGAPGAVCAARYRLEATALPARDAIHLGVLALPATLLWLVFFPNAFTLIDGKDGVAT